MASSTGSAYWSGSEATHAATMLLDELGEEYDGESEALAYLVGWSAAWLWVAIT